jgi:pilus biogenesis lipoprotein CpaD
MKNIYPLMALLVATSVLGACARQNSPSMMNTEKPQIVSETELQQMPVDKVSDGYLHKIASDYDRYGADTLHLSLAYDPTSKSYTTIKAFNDLASIKQRLKQYGVRSITGETVKAEGTSPTLMISYDSARAAAPAGCRNMPGFDDGLTQAHITDYRFGCSIDTMIAQQIYRPSDLQGNGASDPQDGRRAANNVEFYRQIEVEEAEGELIRIERSEISN